MNRKGSKHLSQEDRKTIERMLNDDELCKTIATGLDKDERTISREIKSRRERIENGRYGLYGKFDNAECAMLNRYPLVCNACKKRSVCFKQYKYFYDAQVAHENYKIILSDSRIGLDVTLEDKAHSQGAYIRRFHSLFDRKSLVVNCSDGYSGKYSRRQAQVPANRAFHRINSYYRESIDNMPHELAKVFLGGDKETKLNRR